MSHSKFCGVLLAHVVACLIFAMRLSAQEPSLFDELTGGGVKLTEDVIVALPLPTLRDGLQAADRAAAARTVTGKQDWDQFARNSVMAPVTIEIESLLDRQGNRVGHKIHSAFLIYTNMSKIRDQDFMQQAFARPSGSDEAQSIVTQEIPDAELHQLGLGDAVSENTSYAFLELPLLNKVIVRGVMRIEKRDHPGVCEFFWKLDTRFNAVEKYASQWTELQRNTVGRLEVGASHAYQGCAGFMGVYELDAAQNQLLVESRMILHEPSEWFAGSNFLRSKLPLSMQENARSFRRKLAK